MPNENSTVDLFQDGMPTSRGAPRGLRLPVFIGLFLVVALTGMSWNFSRTPIYRSSANLLTVQPAGVDVVAPAEDPQHVAIQRRLLLSDEVLTRVLATLEQEHVEEADLGWLRKTLAVAPVEKTNLVALSAVGSKPSVLQRVVSVWIDNYLALQAERAAQETDRTHTELGQQQVALAQKIKEKRAELQGFRAEHDISSLDSADNEAHARLRGLNETLNRARERQVSADAALKAHREAAMTGGVVVPADQATELRKIELKVATLRSQQMELESKFKPAYIERDPELRKLPEQIRQLEDVIRRIKTNGQHEVVAKDGEAALAAHNEVMQLEAELVQNKRAANEFTARFAQHDAMRKELKQLEKLYDDNATRVARIELEHARRYPEYQIVDSPFLPQDPEGPAYGRDGGIVLGVALAMALFGAWLTEYLLRKPQEPQHALTGVRIYTGEGPNQLVHQVPAAPLLGRVNSPTGSRFLTGTPLDVLTDEREDRVLSTAELTAILRSALEDRSIAGCISIVPQGANGIDVGRSTGRCEGCHEGYG